MSKVLRPHLTQICLILLAVFLVFGVALSFSFVSLDDSRHLQDNPAVAQFSLEGLKNIWSRPYFGMYAPMTYTLWSGQMAFSKLIGQSENSAVIFHLSNILLHSLNALLVYALLLQLGVKKSFAAIASLIFALHPLQVESVAWVSSFRDLLSAFWGLLFLNLLIPTILLPKQSVWRQILLSFLFLAALLAKPSAVILVCLTLFCFYFLRKKLRFSDVVSIVLWGLMAVAMTVIMKKMQPDTSVDLAPGFGERILLSLQAISFYVQKILWPAGLTPDYGLSPTYILTNWQNQGWAYVTFALAALGIGATLWFAGRKKPWTLGLVFALISILPYTGLVIFNFQNVSIVADRYLYFAMIGVGWSFVSLLAMPQVPQKIDVGLGTIIVMILATLTFQQSGVWKNDENLFTHMLHTNDRSFYAYGGLGNLLVVQGKAKEAQPYLEKAIALRPAYPQAIANLGRSLEMQGKPQDALPKYVQAINIDRNFVGAYISLADLLLRAGRLKEAMETVAHGLEIAPQSGELREILRDIRSQETKSQ